MMATVFQTAGTEWTLGFERPEVLAAAGFSVLALARPLSAIDRAFPMVTRLVGFGIGLTSLLVLSSSGGTTLLPVPPRVAEGAYQGVMVLVCLAALIVAVRRGWNETVTLVAAMFAIFLLCVMSTGSGNCSRATCSFWCSRCSRWGG